MIFPFSLSKPQRITEFFSKNIFVVYLQLTLFKQNSVLISQI